MKKNRTKGFSMVELIIVVAIIGIMTAVATISMGYIQSGNLRSAAKKIDLSLSKLKYDAKSKENKVYLYIYKSNDKYYMYYSEDENASASLTAANGSLICDNRCKITFNGGVAVEGGSYIKVAYKKSGAISSKSNLSNDISDITISYADGTGIIYKNVIYKETGKHTLTKSSS